MPLLIRDYRIYGTSIEVMFPLPIRDYHIYGTRHRGDVAVTYGTRHRGDVAVTYGTRHRGGVAVTYGTRHRGDVAVSYQRLSLTSHSTEYLAPRDWMEQFLPFEDPWCIGSL